MSDSLRFDMTGIPLDFALQVAACAYSTVTGWTVRSQEDGPSRLIFFWTKGPETKAYNKLPAPMQLHECDQMIRSWLAEADYGPEPDHGGYNEKGFRIYNEQWGHIGEMWEAFVAIEPAWLMYGK